MISHTDAVENHPDQGMPINDIHAISQVAAARDEVIIFRDTGCWSRPYIMRQHPTKDIHVKGKSSDWGPHAGLIPLDAELSKAKDKNSIIQGNIENINSINSRYVHAVQVYISGNFIDNELMLFKSSDHRQAVYRKTYPNPRDHSKVYLFSRKQISPNVTENYIFIGSRVLNQTYIDDSLNNGEIKYRLSVLPKKFSHLPDNEIPYYEGFSYPVRALAPSGDTKPLTGDYDLFAVCPSWKQLDATDRVLDERLDYENDVQKQLKNAHFRGGSHIKPPGVTAPFPSIAERIAALRTPKGRDPNFIRQEQGIVTTRLADTIQALRAGMPPPCRVHHGTESYRPGAPPHRDALPLTVFHPRRGISAYQFLTATIDAETDLWPYFWTLYHNGYYPPRNPSWRIGALY